ncbi:aspartate/glutamate racemase family protein [Roseococcus sp. YIM B11640]|uniref:aspartate/glutamate racemase family protein n=1 Tax=Roseococcus sp. YIM B11640 TaxID=3133973 RepID=UPI003C7E8234
MHGRILIINPNSSRSCTDGIAEAVAPFAAPGLPRIDVTRLANGPPAIVTWRDWYGVAEPLCREVEREAADAYVIGCVSDPGLEAVRTVTDRPVFGMFRSAVAAAIARAERFGIIGFTQKSLPRQRRALQAMGVEDRMAGWIPLDLPMEVLTDPVAPQARIAAAARELREQGAEVVVLGCAGMAGHVAVTAEASGLPVIEPCQAAAAAALLAVIGARIPSLAT